MANNTITNVNVLKDSGGNTFLESDGSGNITFTIQDDSIAKTKLETTVQDTLDKVDAVGWKDNIQNFSSSKVGGVSPPQWADIGSGMYAWRFDVGDDIFVTFHVNHDLSMTNRDGFLHIHWLSDSALTAGQTLTWRCEYVIAKGHSQGQSLSSALTTIDIPFTADGTEGAGEHIVTETSTGIDLIEPDTVIMVKITLQSSNVSGDVFGILADLHYQADREHTPNKAPNFYA